MAHVTRTMIRIPYFRAAGEQTLCVHRKQFCLCFQRQHVNSLKSTYLFALKPKNQIATSVVYRYIQSRFCGAN